MKTTATRNKFFRYIRCVMVMLAGSGLAVSMWSQQNLIGVSAAVDQTRITVGDPIKYTLSIDRASQIQLRDPVKNDKIGTFQVLNFQTLPVEKSEGRVIQRYEFTLTAYDTGAFTIPSYPVAYLPADTATNYQIITADPLPIFVESVIKEPDPALKDIRPPLGLPSGRWWLWALLAAGLAAAAIWYFIFRKKSDVGRSLFGNDVIRPAHEIALEELQQLLSSNLLEKQKFKAFYSILSEILRRYIESRYDIRVMEETTAELTASLQNTQLDPSNFNRAIASLQRCDMVKFAKYLPQMDETDFTVTQVRQFIENTRQYLEQVENSAPAITGAFDNDQQPA